MRIISVVMLAAVAWGCGGGRDGRLVRADGLVCADAAGALQVLDSIDASGLSEGDRAWLGLLITKANDKLYAGHESDSLIQSVVKFYASHSNDERYTEALYYAGRVASDMGDAPAALRYYSEAESRIEEAAPGSELHLNILSQKGRQLEKLRLYEEAEEYLKKTLELSEAAGDTANLRHDYQALGGLYLSMRRLDEAEAMIRKAMELAPGDELLQCYLAGIKYEQHDTREALRLIRGIPEQIDSVSRHFSLAYAADIYREAGIRDTAIMYARELIGNGGMHNKVTAYKVVLSRETLKELPEDSIPNYIDGFLSAAEEKYDEHGAEAAMIQNSLYNYANHEAARVKAEQERNRLMTICAILTAIILIAIISMTAKKLRAVQKTVRMQRRVMMIERRAPLLLGPWEANAEQTDTNVEETMQSVEEASDTLKREIMERADSNRTERTASYEIKRSDSVGRRIITDALERGMPLKEESDVWRQAEEYVNATSEKFDEKLNALSGHTLTRDDYRLAVLIRCGATPKDLAALLGRGKSTISMYRNSLCKKLFQEDGNIRELDNIIRSI